MKQLITQVTFMAIKHFPDLCSPDIELLKHVAKVVFFIPAG